MNSNSTKVSSISSKTIDSLDGYNGFRRMEDVSLDKLKPNTFLEIIKPGQDTELEKPVTINVVEVSDGKLSYYRGNKTIKPTSRIKPVKYSMSLNNNDYLVRSLSNPNPSARGKKNITKNKRRRTKNKRRRTKRHYK